MMKKWKYVFVIPFLYLLATIIINLIGEQKKLIIPVKDATSKNWDSKSYWYPNWGVSGVHKGIDVFAPHKTPVLSPISGLVIDVGYSNNGGNYIYIFGSKLRIYYFAHLNEVQIKRLEFVKKEQQIGTVGNTGNAISKPYHLHFSIFSLVPLMKNYNQEDEEGWKKMFYLDPNHSMN